MIAGYRTERLLEPAELVLLPVEVRAAAVRFLVTRVTDVYLPGAEAPGKEFSRYLTRLRTWREIGAAGLRDRAGV
jgi:Ser/Thr protein kinase RdoA (MazF antagonist)